MMRWFLLCVVLCGGCLLAPRSRPRDPGPAVAQAEGGKKGKKGQKLVCKRERALGSHMTKRVCRYEEDQQTERRVAQEAMGRRPPGAIVGPE